MGSGGSKIGKHIPEEELQEGSVPSTPILTPKIKDNNDLDPRSPSTHISRTPLQLLSAAADRLEDLKRNELYLSGSETPLKAKNVLLGIDPRSPTTDFKRTPIVINVVNSELPKKIYNKNLDKVRRSTIITTPEKSILTETFLPNAVPPKLLESSPIKPKPETYKRKSFVGLLETNIDFTETDLDAVILEKCKIKEQLLNEEITPARKNQVNVEIDVDPRSPTNDFLRTPIQIVKKISDIAVNDKEIGPIIELDAKYNGNDLDSEIIVEPQDNKEKSEIMQDICENILAENLIGNKIQISPTEAANSLQNEDVKSSVIEVDVIQVEKNETVIFGINEVVNNVPLETNTNIVNETKSAPVTLPVVDLKQSYKSVVSPILKETKSAPVTPPLVNITADVKELDKKLTNLIYQDENIVICPRIVKLKEHSNRSPLKNRNVVSESEKKKSAQKLKVSDKPRKSDYVVSKIPIFKEKGKNNEVQCENTPPTNMEKRKIKGRKSCWDNADTTLII